MDFNKILQQAQKVKEELEQIERQNAELQVSGEAGAGLVKMTINGQGRICQLHIDDGLLKDKAMLEGMIIAASNDCINQLESKKVKPALPSGLKLPF